MGTNLITKAEKEQHVPFPFHGILQEGFLGIFAGFQVEFVNTLR